MTTLIPMRPAGAADAGTLAALHGAAFPGEAWSAEALATLLTAPGGFGLLAFSGAASTPEHALAAAFAAPAEAARGFILLRVAADEAELLTLAVHPEARRRGLGSRLVAAGLIGAAARGAAALFLEVAEDNGAARALYERAGFATVGRRPGYYRRGAGAIDALVLSRVLINLNP